MLSLCFLIFTFSFALHSTMLLLLFYIIYFFRLHVIYFFLSPYYSSSSRVCSFCLISVFSLVFLRFTCRSYYSDFPFFVSAFYNSTNDNLPVSVAVFLNLCVSCRIPVSACHSYFFLPFFVFYLFC